MNQPPNFWGYLAGPKNLCHQQSFGRLLRLKACSSCEFCNSSSNLSLVPVGSDKDWWGSQANIWGQCSSANIWGWWGNISDTWANEVAKSGGAHFSKLAWSCLKVRLKRVFSLGTFACPPNTCLTCKDLADPKSLKLVMGYIAESCQVSTFLDWELVGIWYISNVAMWGATKVSLNLWVFEVGCLLEFPRYNYLVRWVSAPCSRCPFRTGVLIHYQKCTKNVMLYILVNTKHGQNLRTWRPWPWVTVNEAMWNHGEAPWSFRW